MCISLIIVVSVIASVTEVYRYLCLTDKSSMVDCCSLLQITHTHQCRSKSDPLVGSHNVIHYTSHILLPIIAHVTTQRKCLSHLCTQHCNLQLTKYAVAPNLLMDGCLSHIAILCAWSPSQPPAAQCSPIQLFCNASSRSTAVHNCSAECGWVLPQHYIHYTYISNLYYILYLPSAK